jgi:hypothetical protein
MLPEHPVRREYGSLSFGVACTYSHATLSLQKRVLLTSTQPVIVTDHGTQRTKGRIDTA